MRNDLLLLWHVLFGLFIVGSESEAARATTLILGKSRPEPKIGEDEAIPQSSLARDSPTVNETNVTTVGNNTIKLTGNPQIDYIHDPNLPRELNGFNLTDYPFYNSIPEEINFKCDGLHDGFYASVPHKCQVYHHCLFGTRYDFLCANYTAFDQKTFICHFASEVDCKNSPKYFKRNEALYKQSSTTTVPPPVSAPEGGRRPTGAGGRRKRPFRRRKPTYDYYDDYADYSEDDYEDSGPDRRNRRPRPNKDSSADDDSLDDKLPPSAPNKSVFDRPRVAPKIRRPVPINERDKYDYSADSRLIPSKEPTSSESLPDEDESDRKQKGKPKDSSPFRDGEREKNRGRDSYKDERDEDRDKYRGRDGDRDKNWEREKDRPRIRDEERDRERDSDRDRSRIREDRPRDRRPAKKRRRPESYATDYYDDDYEDVRRPRPRDRPYDEEDDYDYDDRYYRKPARVRDRVRERERERPFRNRDYEAKQNKGHRNRDYEDTEEDRYRETNEKTSKNRGDKHKGNRNRNSDRYEEEEEDDDEFSSSKQHTSSASTNKDSIEAMSKRSQSAEEKTRRPTKPSREEEKEDWKSKEGSFYEDEDDSFSETDKNDSSSNEKSKEVVHETKTRTRSTTIRPTRPTTSIPPEIKDEKPVPAPRPAYITPPNGKTIRKQPETSSRKPSGFRRGTTTQKNSHDVTSEEESVPFSETSSDKAQVESSQNRAAVERNSNRGEPSSVRHLKKSTEASKEQSQSAEPSTMAKEIHEAIPESEELAPRAPKIPTMSSKRRPFLPSRGGDPTLLRGLTAVGAKAFTSPRKDEIKSAEISRPVATASSRERLVGKTTVADAKFPSGIEFRARLTANVGVEQPRLSSGLQQNDGSHEEDYSGEITDSREISKEIFAPAEPSRAGSISTSFIKQTERSTVPLRPTLKTTDFQRFGSAGLQVEQLENYDGSREKKYSSPLSQVNYNVPPALQTGEPQQQQKLPIFQQLGPQTFYSNNPKFKTAVTLSEATLPRPTPTNVNYNAGTHLPNFYQPILKAGQGQVQVVHLQKTPQYSVTPPRKTAVINLPQPGNLEETDEYDVSYNDALQPISSVVPRNTQSGILIHNQRNMAANAPRRRYSLEPVESRKRLGPRIAETNIQPQFAVPPIQHQADVYSVFP